MASDPENNTSDQYRNGPAKMIGNFSLQQNLGKGSMGKVKLGVHTVKGDKIAVKIVPRADLQMFNSSSYTSGKSSQQIAKEKAREENREVRTIREAHMMMLLNHPNIVGLKELITQGPYFYILMDYVSGGQLLHYIVKKQRLTDKRTLRFSRQIVSALDYLHRNSIVHRDLKIENIMIDRNGRDIKIIDFGLSNLFCPEKLLTTYCGSLYFAAPELLKANPYHGPEIDIWSLGVVIFVMATGAVPFDDKSMPGLHEKIKKGAVNYPSHINDDCKDLLSKIFITDPAKRIIMTDIINHPWFKKDPSRIRNHIPNRKQLTLPLDRKVIERMSQGFNLGDADDIEKELHIAISNPEYISAMQYISDCHSKKSSYQELNDNIIYDGPQSVPAAYHAYISLYWLAAEKLASKEQASLQRALSHKQSLSRKCSTDSMGGGMSSNYASQLSEDENSNTRIHTDFSIGNTPVAISSAAVSTNYLTRIQKWLRSSLSQHQLPIDTDVPAVPAIPAGAEHKQPVENTRQQIDYMRQTAENTRQYIKNNKQQVENTKASLGSEESQEIRSTSNTEDDVNTTATAGSDAPQGTRKVLRKLSQVLRKDSSRSLHRKPSGPVPALPKSNASATMNDNEESERHNEPPPPVPPKDAPPRVSSLQPPPDHKIPIPPVTPQMTRSASMAAPSRHGRKKSVTRLTGKIGSWLSRSSSVKHNT